MCLLSGANSLKSVIPGMLDCLSVNIGYAFVKKLVSQTVCLITLMCHVLLDNLVLSS